jgi:hypothetical protein
LEPFRSQVRPELTKLLCFCLMACLAWFLGATPATSSRAERAAERGITNTHDSIPSEATVDFQNRCRGPGVLKCIGFDSESDIKPFTAPDGNGVMQAAYDGRVMASGSGSLRFEIPSRAGQNTSGTWTSGLGAGFGPGQTFYVQFRERFSPEIVKPNSQGNGWKQVIFHMGHKTCGAIELTTQNTYNRGYPQMYTDCGSRSFDVDLGNGDFLYEKGDYNCHRWKPSPATCAFYRANEWMTFYYEVKIGRWGQPESTIKAWVAYDGKPFKQFADAEHYRLDFDSGPSDVYDTITFTPYNTGRSPGVNYPPAQVWYDELIVSSQPIAAPGATAAIH